MKTPLLKIESLSKKSGNEIFAKAEFMSLGGSIKDRTAFGMITRAEAKGLLRPGVTICEGSAGNTGIGIAVLASRRGYPCKIVMPNNQSQEKYQILKALGAEVLAVPPCPFADQNHFYHQARRLSEENSYFWADQFENTANSDIHYQTTGPEIWEQMNHQIDSYFTSVGTGGTIAGVSRYLKEKNKKIRVELVDPMGSGLYSYFKTGELKATGSSITEGIGIMRLTANFKQALIDEATQVDDQAMISMLYHLAKHDGLLVGTSAALNLMATFRFAMQHPNQGLRLVTIIGDSGLRYASKIFNADFLKQKNLSPQPLEAMA